MKYSIRLSLSIILSILWARPAFAQSPTTRWQEAQAFCISDKDDRPTIWGSGEAIPGVYFQEVLPPFFERRLAFSKADLKTSACQWIFTGEDGGVTVTINADSVTLEQRYYNSFGFNRVEDGEIKASRYPQHTFTHFAAPLPSENINSVTLQVTDSLGLTLWVNDTLIDTQVTQLDLSRHQLHIDGLAIDLCGALQRPPVAEVSITLDASKRYQEILGFGGITSPVAYHMLSEEGKAEWWNLLQEYNLLIQREYPMGQKLKRDYSNWDHREEATPHYYGDNFPNGEVSDFAYNQKIQELGGLVIFEFWRFPEWMTDTTSTEGKEAEPTPLYDRYTEAIVNYCQTAQRETGVPPGVVGIQNEVRQSPEVWQQLTLHLRKALDDNGFEKVKIHMHNASRLEHGIEALDAFTADKQVWEDIDYSASNLYDYQNYFTNPDGFDSAIAAWNNSFNGQPKMPFISTEMCINDVRYQSGSYRVAFLMGELYHKNMVDFNAVSMMYCWLLINNVQPSFSASRSLFTIEKSLNNIPQASSFQLRVFGAFSRHLPKGSQRIDASSSDKDLLVSAYSHGNQRTVIVLNRGTTPKRVALNALGNVSTMEVVSPYQANAVQKLSEEAITIDPGDIITFY